MDGLKIEELRKIADIQIANAQKYANARKRASEAKTSLDLLLTPRLKEIRALKRNVGIEMAYLMLIEIDESAKSFYKEWNEQEALYKGYEKLLEAYSSKLIMEQSLMKRFGYGEKYGV